MARKRITTKKEKNISTETKQRRIENDLTEYTEKDYEYTIDYCFKEFLFNQEEKGNSPATIDYYKRFYKKFYNFLMSYELDPTETPIASFTKLKGLQLLFVKSMGEVSVQTVNNYLRGYRSFGNYCEEIGYIEGFKCPIKEVEPQIKQVYSDKEINKLLVKPKIANFTEYRNYVIINLMLSTGARCNTLLNIKISDVNFDEKTIVFNTTKAHRVIQIPLDNIVVRVLKEYVNYWGESSEKGYLFFNEYGEQLTRGGLTKAIATYNQRRGVEKTSLHLFRHTFAKRWIQSGKDIFSLKKILTHSELAMVERYSNIYTEDLRDAVNQDSILGKHKNKSGQTITTVRRNQNNLLN